MAIWVQTVNTPDGFRAEVSQRHRGRARSWRRELLVQNEEVRPGRFLLVGRGYSRTAELCHSMGGIPQLGVAGLHDAREGCRSTIELRFTTILDEGNA